MVNFDTGLGRSLAIETSGRFGSVALIENVTVVAEESVSHDLKHAAALLPIINRLMRDRGWVPSDFQHLFVSEGPGSFTGVRIGVTVAKTLAFATGARIVAVPSLRVLAMNAPPDARNVVLVLDAKRDQIFTARYAFDQSNWIEQERAHLDSLGMILSRSPRPVHLIGEGIPWHEKNLPVDRNGIIIMPEECWRARASIVAHIGIEMAKQGRFVEPDKFVPAYIRKPEAEEKYELYTAAINANTPQPAPQ